MFKKAHQPGLEIAEEHRLFDLSILGAD